MSETETRDADRRPVRLVQVDAETLRQLRSDRDRYKSDRDDAWARCAAEECECVESVNAEVERLRAEVAARPVLSREAVRNRLHDHLVAAFSGAEVLCQCDRTWRTITGYADHLADVLDGGRA